MKPTRPLAAAAAVCGLLLLVGCGTTPKSSPSPPRGADTASSEVRRTAILSVNDVYRISGVDAKAYGGIPRLRTVRKQLEERHPELIVFLAGDFLYPSLLSRVYEGAQMIDVLNLLDGDADGFDDRFFVALGNHEFDRGDLEEAWMLDARVDESQFRWINSNVRFVEGENGLPLVASPNMVDTWMLESGGIRLGIFGLTIDTERPEYVRAIESPWRIARKRTAELRRRGAEVVIGLTHLDMSTDKAIIDSLGDEGPDLILGGHEHSKQFEKVGERWVVKADAEARTAAVVEIELAPDESPSIEVEFRELGPGVEEDHRVRRRVDEWIERHDEEFCREELEMAPGCLEDELGSTAVRLEAEELEIRMYETNLGNWVLDQALEAFRPYGAQVAFINSGSLRLNQDIPPGPITRRYLEELFQYPSGLKLMRLTGEQLHRAVQHSVDGWGYGNGYFLQIAGFAFRHDPLTGRAGDLTLLRPDGPERIHGDDEILAVTGDFLAYAETGQDGFTMLPEEAIVPLDAYPIELKNLVVESLDQAGDEGVSPEIVGRICNTVLEDSPCLALPGSRVAGQIPPAP